MKTYGGFTLVELLVVISIMAVLGVIFSNTLAQTLRGQNKIKVIDQVKQNGQVVLDKISNEIRQAENVVCVNDNSHAEWDTIVLFRQGVYTRIRFYAPLPVTNPTANGYIALDYPTLEDNMCDIAQNLANTQNLTDTDPHNGVSLDYDPLTAGSPAFRPQTVGDYIFSRSHLPGYSDTVTIKFRGMPGVKTGGTYESMLKDGGVLFTTTVQVRGGKV